MRSVWYRVLVNLCTVRPRQTLPFVWIDRWWKISVNATAIWPFSACSRGYPQRRLGQKHDSSSFSVGHGA